MAKHPLVILSSDSEGRIHLTRCSWPWFTRAKGLWLEQESRGQTKSSKLQIPFRKFYSRRELESKKVRHELNKHGNV